MADLNAIRHHHSATFAALDIAAIRPMVKARSAHRPTLANATTDAIGRHAEAVGRGEASVSPIARSRGSHGSR